MSCFDHTKWTKCFVFYSAIFLLVITFEAKAQHRQPELIDLNQVLNASGTPQYIKSINGVLYCIANTQCCGTEFHAINTTTYGSTIVNKPNAIGDSYDLASGTNSLSGFEGFIDFNNRAYFLAAGSGVKGLYSSNNGAAPGIVYPFNAAAIPSKFLTKVSTTRMYFRGEAYSGSNSLGEEIWVTDGTSGGTSFIGTDINTTPAGLGTAGSIPRALTAAGGKLYFTAIDNVFTEGRELFSLDPIGNTVTKWSLIAGVGTPFPESDATDYLIEFNNNLYFVGKDAGGTKNLYRSNGSSAPVNISLPAGATDIHPDDGWAVSSGYLYFVCTVSGTKVLCRYDGTTSTEVVPILGINGTTALSNPKYLTDVNNKLYFQAQVTSSAGGGRELCVSEGGGAYMLADLTLGDPGSSNPSDFANIDGTLYFVANGYFNNLAVGNDQGQLGREIWKSDGTAAGTTIYANIGGSATGGVVTDDGIPSGVLPQPSAYFVVPQGSPPKGTGLFFSANIGNPSTIGTELWYARPCPEYDLSYPSSTLCTGIGTVTPTLTQTKGYSNGIDLSLGTYTVSPSTGLILNASTGEIDLNASTAGSYTITYKLIFDNNPSLDCEGCKINKSFSLTVLNGGGSLINRQVDNPFSSISPISFTTPTFGPSGMAFSPDQTILYVSSPSQHRIYRITLSSGTVSVFAGSGTAGFNDATGASAQFNTPLGIATDIQGNVYVADLQNQVIRKITSGGAVTTIAGTVGSNGDVDAAALSSKFKNPSDVAVDFNGNVYIADRNNNKIKKLDPSGNVSTLATLLSFDNPNGITTDFSGNVYVACFNGNRVLKITPSGTVTKLGGTDGVSGYTNGTVAGSIQFKNPTDVTVDPVGNVYVSDAFNYAVRKITLTNVVTTEAGAAPPANSGDAVGTPTVTRFNNPSEVASDLTGNIYVADNSNNKIKRIYTQNTAGSIAGSNTVCSGTGGTLTLSGVSASNVVKWQKSVDFGVTWTDNSPANASSLTLNYTNIQQTTLFRAIVTNGACQSPSNYATIVVASPTKPVMGAPTILTNPGITANSICVSGNVNLKATGGTSGKYNWYQKIGSGSVTTITTNAADNITVNSVNATTTYYVGLQGASCVSQLDSVKITVNPKPATPTFISATPTICAGGTTTLTVGGAASGESYLWFSDAALTTQVGNSASYLTPTISVTTNYYAVISNGGCYGNALTVPATVYPNPTPAFTGDNLPCANSLVDYTATSPNAANTYIWNITGGANIVKVNGSAITAAPNYSGVNANTITVQWGAGGTGVVQMAEKTPQNCQVPATDLNVTINAIPTPSINSGPNSSCSSTTQTYTCVATAGHDYLWTATGGTIVGANNTTTVQITWGAAGAGQVTLLESVTGSSTCNASTNLPVTITQAPTPVLTSGTGLSTVCASGTDTYSSPATANTFSWSITGGFITQVNGTSIAAVSSYSATSANQIQVTWGSAGTGQVNLSEQSSTNCTVVATPLSITIKASPNPSVSGALTVCGNSTVVYSTTNTSGNTYNWVVTNGNVSSGQGTNQVSVTWNNINGTGTLYVEETAAPCALVTSTTANITIRLVPSPTISGATNACVGTTKSYTAASLGVGNTYQWTVSSGGTITAGGTSSIVSVQWNTAGTQTVSFKETNAAGCSTDATPVSVTVESAPTPVISGATIVCQGQTGVTYTTTSTSNTFNWVVAGGTFTGNGTNTITVAWGAGTTGTVTLTETTVISGCATTTAAYNVSLQTPPTPVVVSNSGSTFCQRNYYSFSTTNNSNRTYTWTVGGGTVASGQGTSTVSILTNNSAALSITVTERVNGTSCQVTSSAYTAPIKGSPTQKVFVSDTLVCEQVTGIIYKISSSTSNILSWTVTGGTLKSGQGTQNITVDWGSAGKGYVIVKVDTLGTGCSIIDTLKVTIVPKLTPTVTAGLRCGPGTVKLRAYNSSALGYYWYSSTNLTTPLNSTVTVTDSLFVTPSISSTQTFYVSAINKGNCLGPQTAVTATVSQQNIEATVTASITNVCARANTGQILLTVSGGVSPYTYVWSNGATTKNITGLVIGTYTVTITDDGGCTTVRSYNVIEDKSKSLVVDAGEDRVIGKGDVVSLQATSTDLNIVSYSWTPTTGLSNSNSANPEAKPDTTTWYKVELVNNQGCVGTDSVKIEVVDLNVVIPNTFSPNNDNINDKFQIFGKGIDYVEVKVYNRLGDVVYSGSGVDQLVGCSTCNNGWDGTKGGQPLPPGNYVWEIKGQYLNGKPLNANNGKNSGNVLLVR